MYTMSSKDRTYYGSKAKLVAKKGRAHLSKRIVQSGGSTKGYNMILSLHKTFMDRTFKTKKD